MALHATLLTTTAVGVGTLFFYIGACIIYNLFFHPLRHYPGPLLMRATRWGYCYKLINGTLPFDLLELHKKYGDVVRIAPDELAFWNARAWKEIMGHRTQGAPEFKKFARFYRPVPDQATNIINSEGSEHSRLRRQMAHGFSDRGLREQQPLIMKYVDLFIQRLHENSTKTDPIDIMAWYNFTTFDIIGDLAFGEPFDCLENSEYHPWVKNIFESARLGSILQTANHFQPLRKLITKALATKSLQEARERNMGRAKEKLQRRMDVGKDGGRPDLIEGLLKKKEELGLSFDELASNSNILIIAGSETTATLLTGLTYHLLCNPQCLAKLTNEVRSSFQKEEDIDMLSVGRLTYMLACIEEALRVYPPVPLGLPRVAPPGGATVSGKFVPENTIVAIHQWSVNHNEQNFKRPFEFHPERFLGDEEFSTDNKEALQPFHVGPRNCVGRNLSYSEMKLILARLIWNFDMELAAESRNWAEKQKIFILWDKGPLRVRLTPVIRTTS
ncbi:Cytochrome P450 ClCP1 [Colletotrichum higginsianum IMI 349063]|uniref:Cytochrome P450 ClCP1 n=3 Tax=Colletotrichum higginsianum TaxID=80884 RepID=A0A1B7Y9V5_COLHI|nr:Cytochrome P450 ClCP1 [Colletotrichum higginsianum IMI 349063]OBR08871.1 Cytochrome P450 ClCP1 [Colletotrichum higginsianum IMI 349063]TIC95614.1 Isotrichodermin C-15 hydroxylase [Colletotrichum higginsianum]